MGTFQYQASDSMMTLTENFNPILISIVNHSMNLTHISSLIYNRFVPKSCQYGYWFNTHTLFLLDINGDILLFTHHGIIFEQFGIMSL